MLEQLAGKENTRELMQTMLARFSPLTNTLADKYVQHKTWQVGTTWTTALKHDKTETFLLVEKTESGIIRVISDAGENHSEMMAIGLAQLESEMPVVVTKKKRKSPKAKAAAKAEVAASLEKLTRETKPRKPRKQKATE